MPYQASVIMQALAPGVALTSMIFYYGNLQQRLFFTVSTIRRLNEEARQLRAEGGRQKGRMESIRRQVEMLIRRLRDIRHAVLFVYVGFFSQILTILCLLGFGFFDEGRFDLVPLLSFGVGFLCMAIATLISSRELALAQKTILDDVDSSYASETLRIGLHRADWQAANQR